MCCGWSVARHGSTTRLPDVLGRAAPFVLLLLYRSSTRDADPHVCVRGGRGGRACRRVACYLIVVMPARHGSTLTDAPSHLLRAVVARDVCSPRQEMPARRSSSFGRPIQTPPLSDSTPWAAVCGPEATRVFVRPPQGARHVLCGRVLHQPPRRGHDGARRLVSTAITRVLLVAAIRVGCRVARRVGVRVGTPLTCVCARGHTVLPRMRQHWARGGGVPTPCRQLVSRPSQP